MDQIVEQVGWGIGQKEIKDDMKTSAPYGKI